VTVPPSASTPAAQAAAPSLDTIFRDHAIKVLNALEAGHASSAFTQLETLRKLPAAAEPLAAGLAYHLAALVSLRLEEMSKTLSAFESAHAQAPDTRQHIEALAIMNARLGRVPEAVYYAKLATGAPRRLDIPGLLPAWMGSFEAYFYRIQDEPVRKRAAMEAQECHWNEAEKFYRQATELNAEDAIAWRGLADARRHLGRPYEALDALLTLHKLDPNKPEDIADLGRTMALLGEWDQAGDCSRHVACLATGGEALAWEPVRLLFDRPDQNLHPAPETAIAAAVEHWSQAVAMPPPMGRAMPTSPGGRRLRLGVLSRRWHEHDGLETILPLLMALPRHSVELHGYADGHARTPLARRLHGAATSWLEIGELDDETLAVILKNDGLDALIDLDGPQHRQRRVVFRSRPVPLQISLGDLAASAGACGFDAVLGDRWTHPETGTDASGAVPVLRIDGIGATLPGDLVLLTPQIARSPTVEGPGRPIVYGTAAGPGRIGAATAQLWAEILRADGRASLRILNDRIGGIHGAQAILEHFKALGLGDRLSFAQEDTDWAGYLGSIDVLLDPPGNADAEAALIAAAGGVPVVSLSGSLPASRILAGWLELIGQSRLAAVDGKGYVAAALAAGSPDGMAARRLALAMDVATESREGARRRALALETALRDLIADRLAGPAEGI
jgi:predicted O-linked N-acetylglucosamine transferase (SPINDLY family)